MIVFERSTGTVVAQIITNRSMCLDEALELIGAEIDKDTLDVYYNGEVYDWEDLDLA